MIKGFAFRRGVLLAALSVLAFQATAAEKVTLQLEVVAAVAIRRLLRCTAERVLSGRGAGCHH